MKNNLQENKIQRAKIRYAKITPRKARLVADMVRGLPLDEALAQLMYNPKRGSKIIFNLLRSAEADASAKKLDLNKLYVKDINVGNGPRLKRYLPRARGTATLIEKKMSHIEVILAEKETIEPKFTILKKQKKSKEKPKEEKQDKKQMKKEIKKEEKIKPEKSKEGFFKRVFRRKSI